MNPICISTGLVYKFTNDRNEMIEILRKFDPDGIELSFADPQYLFDFRITPKNLEYLKGLRHVSIHAPWKNVIYSNNEMAKKALKAIEALYELIGAKNVNFDMDEIEDFGVFEGFDFSKTIENDDWKKDVNSVEKIEKILENNEAFGFNFDFAHALSVSGEAIPAFLKIKRLKQVHLAMLNREMKDHGFLHKYDSEELRESISNLKSVDVPLIFECVASTEEEIPLIRKEMDYIRGILFS